MRHGPADPQTPESSATQPRDLWHGAEEREATAFAWGRMEEAGTGNALAETRNLESHHPYSFHDAPDRENRSAAREAMEARTAGLQAQEKAEAMGAANLHVREPSAADLYGGPQPHEFDPPGSDIER